MTAQETHVANSYESTIVGNLASGATTINVTSTTGTPSIPFYVVIDPDNDAKREVVLVDSTKNATQLNLSASSKRGQDGSTDTSHEDGAVIGIYPVAALWTDINDRVDSAYTAGGTDVAVADGGTGASTAADARSNLGAAADADVVKLTGSQTVAGVKTFSDAATLSSGATVAGEVNMQDNLLTRPLLKDYGEEVATDSDSGATHTIDLTTGNVHDLTLTANCTLTFSNPTASGDACSFTLILRQDGTGSRTVTWPASVDWPAATAPTLSTAAAAVDVLTFVTVDGGTTWLGFVAGQGMA